MCGIVGYVGHREALPLLVDGLARLEYRGYDSAGVSVIDESGVRSVRSVGNLDALRTSLSEAWSRASTARTGIAHTRWATHGDVTAANAHPHTSCDGATHIVLNGIVENHEQLRDELIRRGCTFTSETDAEVVAHLLGCRFAGVDLTAAVRLTCELLRGHFAFLAMRAADRDTLVGARRDCPMVIGCAAGETYVASAIAALPMEMTEVAFIGDDEIVTVRAGELTVTTRSGVPVERIAETVERDAGSSNRGAHSSFMRKEITEQPDALRRTVAAHVGRNPVFGAVTQQQLADISRITITGCGTSHNAAMVGRLLLQRWAGIPTTTAIASEWCGSAPLLDRGELVVGVTQSGETRDTVAALRLARESGSAHHRPHQRRSQPGDARGRLGAAHACGPRGGGRGHQDVHQPGGRLRTARAPSGARAGIRARLRISITSSPSCAGCPASSPRRSPTCPTRSPRPPRAMPTASCSCIWGAISPTRWRARALSR